MPIRIFAARSPNAHLLGFFLIAREMETKFDIIHKANCSWLIDFGD